jgi:hypothetical protein
MVEEISLTPDRFMTRAPGEARMRHGTELAKQVSRDDVPIDTASREKTRMSLVGVLLAVGMLIVLAYRGWSILLLAPAAALVVAAFTREPVLAHWTQTFMSSTATWCCRPEEASTSTARFCIAWRR